ncbi:IS66 family insertion sequence element accessory protein TnpA, partial [Clostridium vincentii]|uniref:IS66 family insertion sequence element accessory protein TnpA n=1 Tax=Clostridium vincentii TaxID=52704 RepID=UPI003119C67C
MAERRSKEEWMILLKEYKVSGVNQTAWCREKGINKGTFIAYKKKSEAVAGENTLEWGSVAIPKKFETSSISLKIGDII